MKNRYFLGLFALLTMSAGSFARDGSSSTGGGLPPKKQRFACHTDTGKIDYRLVLLAHPPGNDSREFEATLYKIENQAEDFLFSPPTGLTESVQVYNKIELVYEAGDVGLFFKLKVFTEKLLTTGPKKGAYRSMLAFDLSGGTEPIKVFDAYCFPNVTPTPPNKDPLAP
jgi:hypothetical protein